MRTAFVGIAYALLLCGCMTVPHIDQDGATITQIVQRVKCELARAVPEAASDYPTGDYQWIKYWTAKVDLDLQTTEQSTLAASAAFTHPLNQVGSFAQTFTLTPSASLDGTAFRTDKLSFTLSVDELRKAKARGDCALQVRLGLLGALGLEEWIKSALEPVKNKKLIIGYQDEPQDKRSTRIPLSDKKVAEESAAKAAKAGATAPSVLARPTERPESAKNEFDGGVMDVTLKVAFQTVVEAERLILGARTNLLDPAKKDMKDFRENESDPENWDPGKRTRLFQDIYDRLHKADLAVVSAKEALAAAEVKAWEAKRKMLAGLKFGEVERDVEVPIDNRDRVKLKRLRIGDEVDVDVELELGKDKTKRTEKKLPDEIDLGKRDKSLLKLFADRAKEADQHVTNLKNEVAAIKNTLPRDPPIDSITHSVKFTVVASGGINPNWTLVRFRGPGLSTPFFKAERKTVHQLDIVLAAPEEAGGKALSDEHQRQLLNLRLDALRQFLVPIQ